MRLVPTSQMRENALSGEEQERGDVRLTSLQLLPDSSSVCLSSDGRERGSEDVEGRGVSIAML